MLNQKILFCTSSNQDRSNLNLQEHKIASCQIHKFDILQLNEIKKNEISTNNGNDQIESKKEDITINHIEVNSIIKKMLKLKCDSTRNKTNEETKVE